MPYSAYRTCALIRMSPPPPPSTVGGEPGDGYGKRRRGAPAAGRCAVRGRAHPVREVPPGDPAPEHRDRPEGVRDRVLWRAAQDAVGLQGPRTAAVPRR